MPARPIHVEYARLPWLIAAMTVILLAIGALAAWNVEPGPAAFAPVRSLVWKLAAAWMLVLLPIVGFLFWSAIRLKKERESAEAAESRYRQLVEQATDIIYQVDLNGYFTYINPTVTRYKGYTPKELLGRHFTEHIRPDAREAATRFYMRQFARRTPSTYYEFPVIKKDGGEIWFGQHVQLLIENGQPVGFQAVARDITERKRAEEALLSTTEFLQTLIQTSPLAIINLDPESNVVSWNRAAEEMLGWSESEVLGKPLPYVPPGKEAEADAVWSESLHGPGVSGVEIRRRKKDGTPIDLAVWSRTIRNSQGSVVSSLGILVDITKRKQAEEALRDSERRFRTIFHQAPLGIAVIESTTGRFLQVNQTYCGIVGLSPEEMLDRGFQDVTHPDDLQPDLDNMKRLMNGQICTFRMEKRYIRKDGAVVWVNLVCVPLWWGGDTGHRLHIAMVEDITERKREERITQALLEGTATVTGKQFFPALVQALAKGLEVRHALVTELLEGEPSRLRMLAIWTDDRQGIPAEYELNRTPCEHVIKQGEAYYQHSVQELFPEDGDLATLGAVSYLGIALTDSSGRTIGHLCILDDKPLPDRQHMSPLLRIFASRAATELERKRVEEEVQRARAFLGSVVDNIPDMVFVKDAKDLRFVQFNKAGEELLGYRRQDLIGRTDYDFFPKEEADFFTGKDRTVLAGKQLLDVPEEPIQTRHGGTRILHTKKIPILDTEGKPLYLLGISEDITERKRAEEELRESRERFGKSFNEAPIGMALVATDGRFVQVNRALSDIVGYSVDELQAISFQAITHPDDLEADLAFVREMLSGKIRTYQMEKRYIHRQGRTVWILLTVSLVHDQERKPLYFIAQIQDITERKRAEAERERLVGELAESKDRFEMFFRQTPSAIAITTIKDGRFLDVNKQAEILTGYSREELIGHTTTEMNLYVYPTDRRGIVQELQDKGMLTDLEREIRTKAGEIRTAVFSLVPILMGSEACMLSIAHDITERKRAEQGLRERSRQQAIEAELSLLAVTTQDLPILLQTAVELIANALEVNYCEVLERLPHSTQLRLCASAGWRGDRLGQVREAERGSLAHAAMHSNKPVVSQDFQADGRFSGPPWLGSQGVVSGLGVAIRSQEESWGALGIYRAGTRAFSRDDANFIQTISNVLAAAIERKQAETVLQNANRALRTLSRQLLQVQEQERRTIARDLHDEIGQSLTAIKLNVERAQRARDRAARVRIMKDSIQITEHVLGQVRDLSLNLHPSILDDLGLAYALKWYADRQAKRAGLNVVVEASPSLPRLSPHLEIACFRIAQEALTNVARHAKATRVSVTIKQGASSVELRVQDDGIGFDIDAVPPPSVGLTSVGLASMQERARLLGGLVRIVSRPGRGTTVIALLPLGLTAPDEIPETETSRS